MAHQNRGRGGEMAQHQLSIATFNLKNLNIPGKRIHRDVDGLSQEEYDAKVLWTANALRDLGADIIGFQELWHPDALNHAFEIAGLRNEYVLFTKPGSAGGEIHTALAVRRPHAGTEGEWIVRFPPNFVMRVGGSSQAGTDYAMDVRIREFSRPVLHCPVTVKHGTDTEVVHVYVAHLKSKLPTQLDDDHGQDLAPGDKQAVGAALSTVRRNAEAAALRMILNAAIAAQPDLAEPIVVVGDLNDGQGSTTATTLSEEPGYRLFDASRAGRSSTRGLYAAATLQQLRSLRDVYFTYIHEGFHDSLDHILASQHFYAHSSKRIWSFNHLRVLNDHLDAESEAKSVPHSDHAPVIAYFDYRGR